MLHLKAMKWYHSAKMYLQQITERIQESFGGSEMIFPAHFTVKHPYLFLYYSCTWTPKFIATSSPMRRICLLHSCFNKCLELPWSALSSTNKEMLNSFCTLVSILFFPPQSDGIWLLQSETREGWRDAENYEWRKTPENFACPAGTGDHRCRYYLTFSNHLSSYRWMRCWNLTVQPKTSTTGSSTAVSCCSLEIWSGLSCRLTLLKIFLFPPGCLLVTMTVW